ncbi:hypothetical protein [Halostagnicola kamekurae]|uniref:Uncharacterized protein n=1 Tax=Halostagnicola kamekurae TaxID=619731 RepID=A0A1I6S9C0_9EURY|nr:hypothetical protein [Halostagnicola kamekurae]SFS73504.1 hypothetical protein SAMN04488556_2504 [Halostagnicola kamekurae]
MIDDALENSRIVRFLGRCRTAASAVLEPFRRAGNRLARYVKASVVYRWLTKEPEPDVIVIDLRETYTIGPFVRLFDRLLSGLADSYERSRTRAAVEGVAEVWQARPLKVVGLAGIVFVVVSALAAVGSGSLTTGRAAALAVLGALAALGVRSTRTLEGVLETRLGRALVAAFEPPEPPASANDLSDDRSEGVDDRDRALEDADT